MRLSGKKAIIGKIGFEQMIIHFEDRGYFHVVLGSTRLMLIRLTPLGIGIISEPENKNGKEGRVQWVNV